MNNHRTQFFRKLGLSGLLTALLVGVVAFASAPVLKPTPVQVAVVTSGGSVSVALAPTTVTIAPGATATLTIIADAGTDKLAALQVGLVYDSSRLSITGITQGPFLPVALAPATIVNGSATFSYGASPNSGGVTGSGTVATLTVKSLAAGTSIISFASTSQAATIGSNSDMLKMTTSAGITSLWPGDLNSDGHVDLFDYNLLVSKFGNPYTIFDYNDLVTNYGK